jgi:peptidoglycan/LPS O-acetylase OafA/YrhL
MLTHRNDIDGLRSLAVVPIMLFHAGVGILRGGYTGVDVFFVISGYLITSIIVSEIDQNRFSILKFYQRRIARILPALFFVLIVTAIAVGPVIVLPSEIAEYFRSAAAASGFVSNIYFWNEIGYFARAAESRPLLHTWSLGVEEQFYIFFPLIMLMLRSTGERRRIYVVAALAIVSLAAGVIVHQSDPSTDFYLLPFRAWELFIGALLALGAAPKLGPKVSEWAAWAGMALVIASIFLLVNWLPFPSPFALLPSVGTALMIAYGENTRVGRILSLAPLRWIGLVSFALYLWHWPIITLYRETTGDQIDMFETVCLIAASFVAATISYYLVEQPARNAVRLWSTRKAVVVGALATGTMVVGSLAIAANAGRIWHVTPEAEQLARYQEYRDWEASPAQKISDQCFIASAGQTLPQEVCLTPVAGKRNVLLFGDSHAEMYGAALRVAFPDVNWLQATHFGCPPVRDGWLDPGCTAMVGMVLDKLVPGGRIDGVVLADRWRPDLMPNLEETIAELRNSGVAVTVIGPVPEYQGSLPIILARAAQAGHLESASDFLNPGIADTDQIVGATSKRAGARYLSVYEALCDKGECNLLAPDGAPVSFDYGHLTLSGASHAIRGLEQP